MKIKKTDIHSVWPIQNINTFVINFLEAKTNTRVCYSEITTILIRNSN